MEFATAPSLVSVLVSNLHAVFVWSCFHFSNSNSSEDKANLAYSAALVAVNDVSASMARRPLCESNWVCPPGFACMPGSPSKARARLYKWSPRYPSLIA